MNEQLLIAAAYSKTVVPVSAASRPQLPFDRTTAVLESGHPAAPPARLHWLDSGHSRKVFLCIADQRVRRVHEHARHSTPAGSAGRRPPTAWAAHVPQKPGPCQRSIDEPRMHGVYADQVFRILQRSRLGENPHGAPRKISPHRAAGVTVECGVLHVLSSQTVSRRTTSKMPK